ncbi:putative deoxyhypusine synthase [Candidatus Anstonella stagnisolia]|nr:putative deoxyhypusine synthase [Candidatus Anstonella stagnisolia]
MDIKGFSLDGRLSASSLVKQMEGAGLQATQIGAAAKLFSKMQHEKECVKFLSFTSNMVSSGLRETFAQMCKEKMCDAIITSIGSVEEDLMKCSGKFELGSFEMDDAQLNEKGINRIGNILVKNAHYIKLEKTLQPFFEKEWQKQHALGRMLSPHEIIADLGATIKDENSFLYWACRNKIPVYCPAPTDGAFGLQLYFFKQKRMGFGIDVSGDLKPLGQQVLDAEKTGALILGGGFAKHHLLGANLLRGGLDYAVYVGTGTQYDGSLSGARVNEAVSWGKVGRKSERVYVECDASIALPLIMCNVLEKKK